MAKVYRVNVKTKTIAREELKEDYRLLGGQSLISKVLSEEVDPTCDPLGAGNKLILCTACWPEPQCLPLTGSPSVPKPSDGRN